MKKRKRSSKKAMRALTTIPALRFSTSCCPAHHFLLLKEEGGHNSCVRSYYHQLGQSHLFWPGQYLERPAWFRAASRPRHSAMGKIPGFHQEKDVLSQPVYRKPSGVEACSGPNGPDKRSRHSALVAGLLLGAASIYTLLKGAGLLDLPSPAASPATLRLSAEGVFQITVFEDLHFGESMRSIL